VAAHVAGQSVGYIQITRGHALLGATGVEEHTAPILLAGPAAETRFRGSPNAAGERRDVAQAVSLLEKKARLEEQTFRGLTWRRCCRPPDSRLSR
jgi:hypothetical protein